MATDSSAETWDHLYSLFAKNPKVYCLMTAQDYKNLLENKSPFQFEVIQEEYMARKRMYIDKGFFFALIRLDRAKVQEYLLEKVLLIIKKSNV